MPELFKLLLVAYFLEPAANVQLLMLLLDGHNTYHRSEVVHEARYRQTLKLCLLPNMTYNAQPLDCIIFSPLKSQWRATCHGFLLKNPEKVAAKFNFNYLSSKA